MLVKELKFSIFQIGNSFFDLQPKFRDNPLKFLDALNQHDADIIRFKAGFKTGYVINHPDLIERILKDEYDKFPKLSSLPNVVYGKSYFGSSAQSIRTSVHMTKTMMATHRLHSIFPHVQTMVISAINQGLGHFPARIDIFQWLNEAMLEIIGEIILGVPMSNIKDELFEMFDMLMGKVNEKILKLVSIPLFVPTPENKKYKRLLTRLNFFLDEMINNHNSHHADGSETLVALLAAKLEQGELSRQQVRDAILTTIVAGYETTSNTIAFLLHYMSKLPHVNNRIRSEFQRLDPTINLDSFKDLPYLQASLSEIVRHLPSVWIMARTNTVETYFGDIKIEKNSLIVVSPYISHHNKKYFDDPYEFSPDRFLNGIDYGLSYIPFGAGPYRCIGKNFALMLIPLFIYHICKKYKFQLLEEIEIRAHITIYSPSGIWMKISPVDI